MMTLLWGIMFIIAGASGQYVLRGTNSPTALIVVGIIMVIWGIAGMATKGSKEEKVARKYREEGEAAVNDLPKMAAPCRVIVVREKKAIGAAVKYEMFLNGKPIGTLKNGVTLHDKTDFQQNVLTSPQLAKDFHFEAVAGGAVHLKLLGITKDGIPFRVEGVEQPTQPIPQLAPTGTAPGQGAQPSPQQLMQVMASSTPAAVQPSLQLSGLQTSGGPSPARTTVPIPAASPAPAQATAQAPAQTPTAATPPVAAVPAPTPRSAQPVTTAPARAQAPASQPPPAPRQQPPQQQPAQHPAARQPLHRPAEPRQHQPAHPPAPARSPASIPAQSTAYQPAPQPAPMAGRHAPASQPPLHRTLPVQAPPSTPAPAAAPPQGQWPGQPR